VHRLNSVFRYTDRSEVLFFSSFERAKTHLNENVQDYRAKGAHLTSSKSASDFPTVWRSMIFFPWSGRTFEITIEEIELDIIPTRDPY
jgi:hypothetical protein